MRGEEDLLNQTRKADSIKEKRDLFDNIIFEIL